MRSVRWSGTSKARAQSTSREFMASESAGLSVKASGHADISSRPYVETKRQSGNISDVPPLKRARLSGNGLYLFHFSTLWEFLLGGYSGRGEWQRGGDGDAGGVEQSADVVARLRNLIIGRSSADADFGDAQAGEAVESFPNRQVAVAPAPPEFLRHQIGQHDDEGMAACAVLGAQIDRPHFQVHGLAVAERPFDSGQVLVAVVHDVLRYDGFGQ